MIAKTRSLRVLHVDSGQEWQSVRDQVRLLVDGLRGVPDIRQAVATLAASRLASECESLGVPVIPLPQSAGGDPRALQALARFVRGGWDVFHAHDSAALTMLLYIQALDGSNTPLIASRRYSAVPRIQGRWQRVSLILASSASARAGLERAGIEPHRVLLVPNGIDTLAPVDVQPGALREAIGARPSHRLVGSFTALTRNRDHRTLLRAARLLGHKTDVRFAVLGRGPERSRVEDMIDRLGLEGRVCLPGYLPDARRYFGDLDAFVMPAFDDELTSACLEAMAAGVPVVMPTTGLADPTGPSATSGPVRVPARDPRALAEALERLIDDPVHHAEVAARGRAFAARHGPGALVRRTVRAYRRIAGPRRAA